MNFSRRALSLSGLGIVLAGTVLAACADGGGLVGPPEPDKPVAPDTSLLAMQCEVDLQTKTLGCEQPGAGGDSRKLILGGQNVFVTLAASNFATTVSGSTAVADTLAMDVTVRNLIPQALGVLTDGTADVANGVRVFFYTGPVAVPSGVASVEDEDGNDTFLTSATPFYRYPQVIRPMETSAPRRWKLAYTPGATNVRFSVYVDAQVQYPDGWVMISPTADTLEIGGTVTLAGTAVDVVGRSAGISQTLAWSSSNDAVATVDASTGLVTAIAQGSAVVTATNGTQSGTAAIVVNNAPMAVADTVDALGNLTVPVDSAQGLLANDTDANGDGLTVVAGTFATDRGGSVTLAADGSLQYLGPAGFEMGYDSVQYTVTDGVQSARAYLHINVGSRVWYVQPGAAAPGDGTDARPFDALAGVDSIADADETVYVLGGGSTATAENGITLKATQSLVGQALVAPVETTLNERTVVLLAVGNVPLVRRTTAGATVTLGTDNTVMGLRIGSTSGAAVAGVSFGTFTADSVSLDANGGPALDLNTGTLSVSLDSLASAGSTTNGVSLAATDGTLTATTGTVAGTFLITGGSISVTYAGSLSETNGMLVGVSGTHTGTLVFSGALGATGGPGLQFNDADGAYTFSGTTTLAGGDAGIDVVGGSAGTFSFGASTTITNPTGDALTVSGSAPTLTYAGSISANAGRPVLVDGLSGGSVEISGDIASTGLGILVQNNTAGAVSFTGAAKSLSTGTNPAVVLANNGTASMTFAGGGLQIATTSAAGFTATGGGLVQVTGAGNRIATTTGTPVTISGTTISGSGVTFAQVSADGAANGIVLSNTGATNGFQVVGDGSATAGSGGIIQNTTGVAVSLTSTDSTVLRYLTITGAGGIQGSDFGALTVENVAVTSVGVPALNLATGEVTGTFSSITASGATNGVNLSAVNGFFAANGGTVTGGTGAAFNLSGGDVGVVWNGSISQANAAPLVSIGGGHNTGTVTFQTGTLSASAGPGLRFDNADGSYAFTGTTTLNGGDAGVDIVTGSNGTFTFGTGTSITSPSGTGFYVNGGAPNVTYSGNITYASPGRMVDVSSQFGGTITFQTGTLSATAGTGILLNNADGSVAFNGTTTLNGGDAGVDVENTSNGTLSFGSGASISNPSGIALSVSNSSPSLTFAGPITHNAGRAVFFSSVGGTATLSGDIAGSGASASGILVQNSSANVTFSGASKSLSTQGNPAVTLWSNSGSILFSGGGLALTTTSGNGFSATGGGTVQVTGAGNTITSTGGVALNVQSTSIGASGLSFQRIDASGGSNGIVLNNTGNVNGVQVTGTGTASSGGTIQNTSGAGIALVNASNVRFNNLRIVNTTRSGVEGTGVTNFEFTNGSIDQSGDAPGIFGADESNISFFDSPNPGAVNITGVVTITNNTLSNAYYHGIRMRNAAPGTISALTISDNVITTPTTDAASVGSGINIDMQGAGINVTRATINNNDIFNVPTGVGILMVCGNSSTSGLPTNCGTPGSGTDVINITNNQIWGQSSTNRIGSEGLVANMNGRGQGNFNVSGNDIRYTDGRGMGVSAFGQVRMHSTVANNTIISTPLFDGTNMEIGADSTSGMASFASYTATVTGNNVSGHTGPGVWAIARGSSDSLRVKILNNTVARPNATAFRGGIQVFSGSAAGNTWVCARVEGNTTEGSTSAGGTKSGGILFRKQGTVTDVNTFGIHGLPSSPANSPTMESHWTAQNPASVLGSNGYGATRQSGSNFVSCNLP